MGSDHTEVTESHIAFKHKKLIYLQEDSNFLQSLELYKCPLLLIKTM